MENFLTALLIVGLALLLLLIRFVVHRAADKAGDAVRNAWIRSKARREPPQTQSLAELYAGERRDTEP